jgi:hypothetical protein
VLAVIAMCDQGMAHRMQKTPLAAATTQAVIPWILGEYCRICEVGKEAKGCLTCEVRPKTLTVAFRALPERRVLISGLIVPALKPAVRNANGSTLS